MKLDRTVISTESAPQALGPYSQAVRLGDLLFCSGQIALNPQTGQLVGQGDVAVQTSQALDNIAAVLAAAGGNFAHVVKTTIFLNNMDDFATVNQVYGARFGQEPPARSTVEVARLPLDALVEIEVIAAIPTSA